MLDVLWHRHLNSNPYSPAETDSIDPQLLRGGIRRREWRDFWRLTFIASVGTCIASNLALAWIDPPVFGDIVRGLVAFVFLASMTSAFLTLVGWFLPRDRTTSANRTGIKPPTEIERYEEECPWCRNAVTRDENDRCPSCDQPF